MVRRLAKPAALAVLLLGLLVVPAVTKSYGLFVVSFFLVTALASIGLNLVMGYAGLVSLGHAGFVGIGAYVTAVLVADVGLSYWLALLVAAVVSGAVGYAIGLPSIRLSPLYLAVVTFGFGQIVVLIARNWLSVTGGPNGIRVPAPSIAGTPLDGRAFYYVLLFIVVLLVLAARNFVRSKTGRALLAVRDSSIAAEVAGVNLVRHKTAAFALSAVYGGLAGGLYLGFGSFVTPDSFVFAVSLLYVTMNVVGGMGSLVGAVLGAAVFTVLPEVLRGFAEYRELVSGSLLLVALLFMPRGIVGIVQKLRGAAPAGEPLAPQPAQAAEQAAARQDTWRAPAVDGGGALLDVQDVSISFGGLQALDRVSLRVHAGEIKALIGPNGSGKTTFINVVTGIYQPDDGAATFAGTDLLKQPAHALAGLGLSRTFQNLELFDELSVLDNLLIGMHAQLDLRVADEVLRTGKARAREREAKDTAMAVLSEFGLGHYAGVRVDSLPFGHQRMVEIARAVMGRPRLLLLDEPGAGLTSEELEQLAERLMLLRDRHGTAILLVAHTMRLVMGVSDSATVLDQGAVIAEGVPSDVVGDPRVVDAYLGRADADAAGG